MLFAILQNLHQNSVKHARTSLWKTLAKRKDFKTPIALSQKNKSTHNWGYYRNTKMIFI